MMPFSNVPGLSGNYLSPWDKDFNTDPSSSPTNPTPVFYKFENWTGDWGSPHLLTLRVTPYVGLAYFDGKDDGDYYNYNITGLPNLFANGSEIGNFIPASPFDIDGTGIPAGGTVQLDVKSSADHCPVIQNTFSIHNPNSIYFDISGIVGTNTVEEKLLKDYGKVYFYYLQAINPVTNVVVWDEYMMPSNNFASGHLYWDATYVIAPLPFGYMLPMYYNYDIVAGMPVSHEAIVDVTSIPESIRRYKSEAVFTHNGYNMRVRINTDLFGMYVKLEDF